ncbi:nitrilase-related carbon-nitrogen hydrolase [Scopulibacillus cellulosilyticus]|uniref:Nitrilase-related carbon-nitrogen hydrolase n=1 Tax=Scopulibacillus cellulosilyticus TaxID=2665665 RepID=A0ABW2PX17_9BACL
MKFGIVQSKNLSGIESVYQNRKANREAIEDLFKKGAKVVVLPECSNSQYVMKNKNEVLTFSEPLKGESYNCWSELASFYNGYIVGGILERDNNDIYNTAILIGPDGYIGHYRKVHLFDWEKKYLSPGNFGFPVFSLPDLDIKVGMLICYDLRFPEAVRSIALAGCDVLLVPTTWTSIGKKILWDDRGFCLANYLAVAHSYSNRLAIVCADRAGHEHDVRYLGSSLIIDSGSIVAAGPASKNCADCLIADLEPEASRNKKVGSKNDLFRDRRPESYFQPVGK